MLLSPVDVEFPEVPLLCETDEGTFFYRRIAYGMPKLGQYAPLLRSVFFLYENETHALSRTHSGGTGFLVAVRSKRWPDKLLHIHAVTNHHVAVGGSPVVRLDNPGSAPNIVNFDVSDWVFRRGFPDLAISPPFYPQNATRAYLLADSWCLTEEQEKKDEIGPADDVFMIGRFVDYQGVATDLPAVRFGHISMMEAAVEQTSTGYSGRSIVVDMHSRSGFSGSPVFVYRTLGSHFLEPPPPGAVLSGGGHYIKLLGIHWAQFPERWTVKENSIASAENNEISVSGNEKFITGLSGMTCVIPSACILDLLGHQKLTEMREQEELRVEKIMGDIWDAAPQPETTHPKDDVAKVRDGMLRTMLETHAQPRAKADQKKVKRK